jgi:hypothetical protein
MKRVLLVSAVVGVFLLGAVAGIVFSSNAYSSWVRTRCLELFDNHEIAVLARIVAVLAIDPLWGTQEASAAGTPLIPGIDGKSILLVRRPDPGFELVTSSGTAAGALAVLGPQHGASGRNEMQNAGRHLVADDQIEDPAVSLSAALLADLARIYKLRVLEADAAVVPDDKQLESFRKQKQVDLILEFHTEAWRTYYFFDLTHYDIWYYAKARLIDGRTGSPIRQAKCAHKPAKSANSPTIEELLADNGAKLGVAVEAAKQVCMATVREEFGVHASP